MLMGPCIVNIFKHNQQDATLHNGLVSNYQLNTQFRSQPVCCTAVYRMTIPDAVIIQFVLLKMRIVLLETCRGL